MGLGSFPEVSLKKARLEASIKRSQLSDGVDPLAARDIERAAQRAPEDQPNPVEHQAQLAAPAKPSLAQKLKSQGVQHHSKPSAQ